MPDHPPELVDTIAQAMRPHIGAPTYLDDGVWCCSCGQVYSNGKHLARAALDAIAASGAEEALPVTLRGEHRETEVSYADLVTENEQLRAQLEIRARTSVILAYELAEATDAASRAAAVAERAEADHG